VDDKVASIQKTILVCIAKERPYVLILSAAAISHCYEISGPDALPPPQLFVGAAFSEVTFRLP
jgi:hypothetical protein